MTDISPYRVPNDFYPTPPMGTRALLSVETFDGPIWEPACGDGAIAKVLSRAGYLVVATDLINRGYGQTPIDFLAETTPRAKHIITNPPYGRGLGDSFIRHALHLSNGTQGTVAMLLDLASLAHPRRTPLFLAHPPTSVIILDDLICQPAGRPVFTTANYRYCWMVWKKAVPAPTTLKWIATARFRYPKE